ncbi:MAG TPA: Hsp20/alpha crystallin family protein [Micromonospora sp.]
MMARRWRGNGSLVPFDWSPLSWLPFLEPPIRIEEYLDDDRYVVRAELPGVDPTKDVEVTSADGVLHLRVERSREHHDNGRSEFHYGSFYRAIPLPAGAREDDITATYSHGILDITVPLGEPATRRKQIPISVAAR